MATTKKTTTKKPATRSTTKSTAAKKTTTVAKKAPVKKTTATKKTVKKASAKAPQMRSFRVANDQQQFTSFRITRQTVYWIILVAFIIFVQLWILKLQIEVVTLIDAQQAQLQNF
jgi:hypothetical protein